MADLMLVAREDQKTEKRMNEIARMVNQAEQLLKAPVRDIQKITELAVEMRDFGLKIASRKLLDAIER